MTGTPFFAFVGESRDRPLSRPGTGPAPSVKVALPCLDEAAALPWAPFGPTAHLPHVIAGALVVPVVFAAPGGVRPHGYRMWADLARTVPIIGPATAAGPCARPTGQAVPAPLLDRPSMTGR